MHELPGCLINAGCGQKCKRNTLSSWHDGKQKYFNDLFKTKSYLKQVLGLTFLLLCTLRAGGVVASRLVRLSSDRVVWVRTLAKDIVLCSWAAHLKVSLFTQAGKSVPRVNFMLRVTLGSTKSRNIPSRFTLQNP